MELQQGHMTHQEHILSSEVVVRAGNLVNDNCDFDTGRINQRPKMKHEQTGDPLRCSNVHTGVETCPMSAD